MKKVLFVLPSLAIGGLEKVQVTIANALCKKGYDVTIMALNPENDFKEELDSMIHYIYKPYKSHKIMSRIPYIRHKFYDDGMWERRASPKTLYKYYVGEEKYDVEIGFFRGLSVKIISGSTNKESVKLAWVHNDFRKASGYMNNFNNMKEVYNAYSRYNKVVCVSKQAEEGFIKVVGDTYNLTTIYNMVPIREILELSLQQQLVETKKAKLNLVLVGRLLDSAKGQIRLIDVVSRLHNEGNDLSLTLVGDGPDRKIIEQEIELLKAKDYIYMVGSQSNPYPYIKMADLLICASYFEGYNLTVAEALVLDTPVLSTNCTGPNEILDNGKYGFIVDNSAEGLYNGVKKILQNQSILNDYKNRAKERLDFFNESKILNQIEDLFLIKG